MPPCSIGWPSGSGADCVLPVVFFVFKREKIELVTKGFGGRHGGADSTLLAASAYQGISYTTFVQDVTLYRERVIEPFAGREDVHEDWIG